MVIFTSSRHHDGDVFKGLNTDFIVSIRIVFDILYVQFIPKIKKMYLYTQHKIWQSKP